MFQALRPAWAKVPTGHPLPASVSPSGIARPLWLPQEEPSASVKTCHACPLSPQQPMTPGRRHPIFRGGNWSDPPQIVRQRRAQCRGAAPLPGPRQGGRSHPKLSPRSSGSAPGPAPSLPVSEPEPAAPGWQAGGCSAQPCSVCAHLWAQRVQAKGRVQHLPWGPLAFGRPSPCPGQPHPYKHRESTEARLTLVWPRGLPSQP